MKFSFFCRHCGLHLSKGNHAKCKKILMARDKQEAERAAASKAAREQRLQQRYTDGTMAEVLPGRERHANLQDVITPRATARSLDDYDNE